MNSRTTTMGNEGRLLRLVRRGDLRIDELGRVWHRDGSSAEYSKGGSRGHLMVSVYIRGVRVRVSSHRLVYRWAHGPIRKGNVVDHIDDVKTNNAPSNLQQLTPKQNTQKAIANGQRGQHGAANPASRESRAKREAAR